MAQQFLSGVKITAGDENTLYLNTGATGQQTAIFYQVNGSYKYEQRVGTNWELYNYTTSNWDFHIGGSTGYLALGHNSPSARLHLSGDNAAKSAIRQSRTGTIIWDQAIDSSGRLQWGTRATEGGTRSVHFTLDDNSKVGVGIGSPDSKFHVEQDPVDLSTTNLDNSSVVAASFTIPDAELSGNGKGIALALGMNGRGRSYIATEFASTNKDATDLAFYTENGGTIVERMRIDQSGNVGIGTSPASGVKLHVNGEVRVDSTSGIATRKIRSSYFSSTTDIVVASGSSASVRLQNGTTDGLVIDSSQNAAFTGIVSVPTGKAFRMYNAAGNGWGEITLEETANKIQFNRGIQPSGDNQSDQLLGTSSKRWYQVHAGSFHGDGSNLTGITASNADTVDNLHAASFIRSDAADTAANTITFTSGIKSPYVETVSNASLFLRPNGTGHVYLGDSGNGNNLYHYSTENDGKYTTYDWNNNYYRIGTSASSGVWINDDLRISGLDANGNADISGTLVVGDKITANGGIEIGGGTIATATAVLHTNNVIYFRGGSSGLFLQNADGSDGYYISNSDHTWDVGSSATMRLNSTGLGIGNTSPDEKLRVDGNIKAAGDFIGSGLKLGFAGTASIITNDSNEDLLINPNGSGDILMHTTSTGNVGIGHDAPSNKLHVKHSDDVLGRFESTDANAKIRIQDDVNSAYVGVTNTEVYFGGNITSSNVGNLRIHSGNSNSGQAGYAGFGTTPSAGHKFRVGVSYNTSADTTMTGITADMNVSGTDAVTSDRTIRGFFADIDSSATGGNTTDEVRLHGFEAHVTDTGDADQIQGFFGQVQNTKSSALDNVTNMIGGRFSALADNSAGTIANIMGTYSTARVKNSGTKTTVYVNRNELTSSTSDADVTNVYGVYSRLEPGSNYTGTIATSRAGYFEVESENNNTFTNAYAVEARIDHNGGTITNAYQLRGVTQGTITTDNWGIHSTGAAKHRLDGKVSINTLTSPTHELTVGGDIKLTGNQIFDDGEIISDGTNFGFDGKAGKEVYMSSARDISLVIDDNDDDTSTVFKVYKHSIASGNELLTIDQSGNGTFTGDVIATDGSDTSTLSETGLTLSRSNSYIQSNADNSDTLNIGQSSVRWGHVKIDSATFKVLNGGNERLGIDSAGVATFASDIKLPAASTLNFSTDIDLVHSTNKLLFKQGGSDRFSVSGDVGVVGATDFYIPAGRKLLLDGLGGHTYIEEESDSNLKFYVAGGERLNVTNTEATFTGNLTVSGTGLSTIAGQLYVGQTSDYFGSATKIQLNSGASNQNVGIRSNILYLYSHGNGSDAALVFGDGGANFSLVSSDTDFNLYNYGTTSNALTVLHSDNTATFEGDLAINGATLATYQQFNSDPITSSAANNLFSIGGQGMAGGYSRNISIWSTTVGTWRSWVGTNLRWDGTNYKRATNQANNNWGNIAGLMFHGNSAATGKAIEFIIDPPESADSGTVDSTIGTSIPSGYTALALNNDLSASFDSGKIKIDNISNNGRIHGTSSIFLGGVSTSLVQLSAKLIPDADSSRDLGTTSRYWKDAYIDTITTTGAITSNVANGKWRVNSYGAMYFRNSSNATHESYIHSRSDGSLSIGRVAESNWTGSGAGAYAATTYDHVTFDTSSNATFAGDIIIGANYIGRDGDNYIGFVTDNLIKFRVNGNTQVKLSDGVFAPQTDSDVDLGSSSTRFKDAYVDSVTVTDDVTIGGDLTVIGTTQTVNQTNLDISDNIIGLNRGATSNANDSGIIIERGSTGDNATILWDESIDQFVFGLTTAVPSDTGNIALSTFVGLKTGALTTAGHILPSSDSSYNLGADGTRWASCYFDSLSTSSVITCSGDLRFQSDLAVLNKAQGAYIDIATRDTSGAEVVYNLSNVGTIASGAITSSGNISHTGLTMTTGTDIDQVYEAHLTLQLAAETWTDTGINSSDLATGTYAVQMYVSDFNVSTGGHYYEYYSGMMSWYGSGTNAAHEDEIPLHRAGHSPNNGHMQLKTVRHGSGGDNLMLQIKSKLAYSAALDNSNGGKIIRFKFRRLI